jgi:hypothetical protein
MNEDFGRFGVKHRACDTRSRWDGYRDDMGRKISLAEVWGLIRVVIVVMMNRRAVAMIVLLVRRHHMRVKRTGLRLQ